MKTNNDVNFTSAGTYGIIIPVYGDDQKLNEIVSEIERLNKSSAHYRFKVLIVDDGSPQPVQRISSRELSVQIIRIDQNLGKGNAIKRGFQFFRNIPHIQAVITMDADMQHPPQSIPGFISRFKKTRADVIIGRRSRKLGVMPFHRILSNFLTSLIISLLTGRLVRDSQCGFRLYAPTVFKKITVKEDGFHFESEILLRSLWKQFSIDFVSIPTIYGNEHSSIRNIIDTLNFVKVIFKTAGARVFGNV